MKFFTHYVYYYSSESILSYTLNLTVIAPIYRISFVVYFSYKKRLPLTDMDLTAAILLTPDPNFYH